MNSTGKQPNPVISADTSIVAARNQVSADIGNEMAVLNLDSGVYYGLNEVGAYIWSFIEEPRTVLEITRHIQASYEIDSGTCHDDLLQLLDKLAEADLIEVRDEHSG